jgi:hypothetical protein
MVTFLSDSLTMPSEAVKETVYPGAQKVPTLRYIEFVIRLPYVFFSLFRRPNLETAGIAESVVLSQLRSVITSAAKIAAYRNSNVRLP